MLGKTLSTVYVTNSIPQTIQVHIIFICMLQSLHFFSAQLPSYCLLCVIIWSMPLNPEIHFQLVQYFDA